MERPCRKLYCDQFISPLVRPSVVTCSFKSHSDQSCRVKSQFWRRHLCKHLEYLHLRTHGEFNHGIIKSVVLILLLLPSCVLPQHANQNPGNGDYLTSLNDEQRSADADVNSECKLTVSECEPIKNETTCFGVKLPYSYTSLVLASDSENQEDVQKNLMLWQALRNAPRCWDVVQPLLCGVYLPNCTSGSSRQSDSYISLVGKKLCETGHEHCKVVDSYQGWPDFLKCDQPHFPPGCTNVIFKKVRFNSTGRCEKPLVPTDNKLSWYSDVEGCGIQCENPLFTEHEHWVVHVAVGVSGSVCAACTLFTVLTFVIDWPNAKRYPALILFFVNACFLVGSVGWLAQFIPGAREDIVCRSDGTIRKAEPQLGSGESASCVVVFVLVYYSFMAGLTWFVILAYAWHLTFKVIGTPRDVIEGKKGHFHLTAWSIPLVLTVVCLALKEIDGDSVSGICFVGNLNGVYRGGFVLAPVGIAIACGLFFLLRGLLTLCKLKGEGPGVISNRASAKLRETIIRIGLFASLAFCWVAITFAVHVYMYINEPEWTESFKDFVVCEANVTVAKTLANTTVPCVLDNRPSLAAIVIHMLAFFGAGITMSSWVWNSSTADAWKRFFRRCLKKPDNKVVKLQKHKVIAQAYGQKRKKGQRSRHISFSFQSSHDDPLGMRFDLNSNTSQSDMSSRWAIGLPRLMKRRHGVAYPVGGNRRHSDSDAQSVQSYSRRLSIESRRMSMESVLSDVEFRKKKKKKKTRKQLAKNRVVPVFPDSETSQIDCGGSIQMDTFVTEHVTSRHISKRLRRHGCNKKAAQYQNDEAGSFQEPGGSQHIPDDVNDFHKNKASDKSPSKQTKVHPFSINDSDMGTFNTDNIKQHSPISGREKRQSNTKSNPISINVRPASETSMWTSDSHSVYHTSTRDQQGVETGYLNTSFRRGSNASSNASNASTRGSGRPDSSGRQGNQRNNHVNSGQILQVNQLQHQYNMFTASSFLPQPPGTVSNTCTDLGSVTSLDVDMESSMARLECERMGAFMYHNGGMMSGRFSITPEMLLELEDLENTDHWSENSLEFEKH